MATTTRHVKRRERLKMRNKMKKKDKRKTEFLSDQAWKPFEVDMSVFADDEIGGFVGLEVLTDYDPKLLQKDTSGTTKVAPDEDQDVLESSIIEGGKASKRRAKAKQKREEQKGNKATSKKKLLAEKKKTQAEKRKKKKVKSLTAKDGAKTTPAKSAGSKIDDDGDAKQNGSVIPEKTDVGKDEKKKEKKTKTDNQESIPIDATKTEEAVEDGNADGKRKRKSGRERLEELKMRKKRRKSEQTEEEIDEQKTGTEPEEGESEVPSEDVTTDNSGEVPMTTWENLSIPTPVHKALQSMGFDHPTPIQTGCIPAAINDRRDVVGAAETGSGKTLAFGIPLIYWLLRHKAEVASGKHQTVNNTDSASSQTALEKEDGEKSDRTKDDGEKVEDEGNHHPTSSFKEMVPMDDDEDEEEVDSDNHGSDDNDEEGDEDNDSDDDDDDDDEDGDNKIDLQKLKSQIGCVDVVDNINDEAWEKAGLPLVSTRTNQRAHEEKLFGLVLTPTRELAVQVKNHLVAAAKMTDIKIAVVVGGMSAEKQKRMLKKRPEIIVGTPGRLWELYNLGEPHLSSLPDVQCLIIDEADRMVEKGHYAELSDILDLLNSNEKQSSRQIFVFSATLSLIHLGPLRKSLKKAFKMDKKEKLDSIIGKVGIKENALMVDLTNKEGTASTLLESKIISKVEEKDIYLFYFLRQYPGRTLVFTNSIDCIRRLVSIMSLLQCQPLPLHSSMHQKQRLKNLERFTSNPRGLLLATDVAARGLDIPDIEHVIHYQVPRTSESYVHRSGRTARQAKTGLSVTFIAPSELDFYRRLCKTLNREELPSFPIDLRYYEEIKERVEVARDVDKLEHVNNKKRHSNDWFVRAAKELDVDLDEDQNLHDMGDLSEQKQYSKKVKMMRAHLKALLKKKIFASGSSQLYLTSSGTLLAPLAPASSGAHQAVSKLQARMKKDRTEDQNERQKKRKKFKRMGRYQKS